MRDIKIPSAKHFSNFLILFTYATVAGDETPVMAICGKRTRRSYLIPLENAHAYADSISGEPTDHLLQTAVTIGNALGLGDDKYTIYELCSAIVDNLPDLVEMPPKVVDPQKRLQQAAERDGLVVTLDGNKVIDAS